MNHIHEIDYIYFILFYFILLKCSLFFVVTLTQTHFGKSSYYPLIKNPSHSSKTYYTHCSYLQ
jgi:hypothetical protein